MSHYVVLALIVAGAIISAIAAFIFGARAAHMYRGGSSFSGGPSKGATITVALLCTLLAAFLIYGAVDSSRADRTISNFSAADVPTATPKTTSTDPQDAGKEEEEVFLDTIHLTDRQIDDFVGRHTLNFVDRSLVNNQAKAARLKAVRDFCGDANAFADAVNWPIETWFPDYAKLANLSSLSETEREALIGDFFDAFDQEMISNQPFGLMLLHGAKEIPYIYKNNAELIDGLWNTVQAMFAGTYEQPIGDEDAMALELNKIPTLPKPCVGIDYFVQRKAVGVSEEIVVREEWARTCAYLSAAYRGYFIRGIEARESIKNWCLPSTLMEDSKALPVLADYQENREAIILSALNKSGKPSSLIGLNTADSRLEVFPITTPQPKQDQPEPDKPQPDKPQPDKPKPDKPKPDNPDPEPELPPTTYTLRVFFQLGDGSEFFPTVTEYHEAGDGYDVKVKEDSHYEVHANKEIVTRNGVKYVSGTMPAQNHDVYVIYDPYLYIYYVEGPTGRSCSEYGLRDYKELYEYNEYYSVESPEYLNWIPDKPVVSGYKAARYEEFIVTYWPPADGQGGKDPSQSSQNQGNAETGGGSNLPTDGTGEDEPTKPPKEDYPETPNDNPAINTPSDKPIDAGDNDNHDSSGQGGQDHPIQDPNHGNTDNGDPPPTDPIPVDPGTSGTDLGTGAGGQKPEDEGANNGEILPPP